MSNNKCYLLGSYKYLLGYRDDYIPFQLQSTLLLVPSFDVYLRDEWGRNCYPYFLVRNLKTEL